MLYCKGATPFAPVAVMVPLFWLQEVVNATAVTVGELGLANVTWVPVVHPVASFTPTA